MTAIVDTPAAKASDPSKVDSRVVRRRLGPGHRIRFAFWVGPIVLIAIW